MRIAILGPGAVGTALARAWSATGHDISFGTPNPSSDKVQTAIRKAGGRCRAMANAAAVAGADVVVLSVRWSAAEHALRAAGDLRGRLLIDCTNPLSADLKGLVIGHTTSAAEQVAAWTGARVVKAFSTLAAEYFGDAEFAGMQADGYYCGDDAAAKAVTRGLIAEAAMNPVDTGPLRGARLLEPMALLYIQMANDQGWGRRHAFKLLRRGA